jgi:hypothetical protein
LSNITVAALLEALFAQRRACPERASATELTPDQG